MKSMKKKLLSFVLSVVMVLSVLPTIAFAEGDAAAVAAIDAIIEDGRQAVNAKMSYAVLGKPAKVSADKRNVPVRIKVGTTKVSTVYNDIIDTLVTKLDANAAKVSAVINADKPDGSGTLALPVGQNKNKVVAFVKTFQEGLNGNLEIQKLYGSTFNIKVVSKDGAASATYAVKFADAGHTHRLEKVAGKAATCTETGIEDYYVCTDCGGMFADAGGRTEIDEPKAAAAKGHVWGDWKEENGYQVKTCSACGAKEQGVATVKVPKKVAMKTGQSTTKIQVPLAPGDHILSVKSSNTKVAKVKVLKDGRIKVKAKKKTGTVRIKVRLESGKTLKFKVKVQKNKVLTSKVTAPEKLKLQAGAKAALNAKVTPVTTSQGVSYHSSDPDVARVSKNGTVRALKKGTAVITVTSGSKKAVCKVKVR